MPSSTDLLSSPFRPHSKISLQQAIRLSFNFAQGVPLTETAMATELSRKSVREVFSEFRETLLKPSFNRWHETNRMMTMITQVDHEVLIRSTFFEVLATCQGDTSCYRNYQLGNRKKRLCRKCPLPGKFSDPENLENALATVDAAHQFYEHLGWRGEKAKDPVQLFRLRFIHTATVATARANTRFLPNGIANPADDGFLSVATLAQEIVAHSIELRE